MLPLIGVVLLLFVTAYLWHVNRAISTAPDDALDLCQKHWTKEEVQEAYRKAQTSPTDVKPFLFSKKNRRYIVVGGSGLVGGWIIHHLLMRGEDPAALRILDIAPTTRKEAIEANIDFIKTDVSDPDAVSRAFNKQWPDHVKSLPLTVFHCVAYINPADRKSDFLPIYVKVNVVGTKNVVKSAQAAGASCLIATSSASISIVPPSYFPLPWERWPKNIYQLIPNAEPKKLDGPLEDFVGCYAWSKAQAEKIVRDANNPQANFLTGAIRPGHAIYGHGVENPSSITWDYLRRGGIPSWVSDVVVQFVSAQNVSIGHLAYEDVLIKKTHTGGKGYCVTDPNPAIRYLDFYRMLGYLAHPLTKVTLTPVMHVLMFLLAQLVERYNLLQHRHLRFLPAVKGDVAYLQPATFNMCAVHLIYTDDAAKKEIGYRPAMETKEGFALAMLDWNQKVEEKIRRKVEAGKGGEVRIQEPAIVPKLPNVH